MEKCEVIFARSLSPYPVLKIHDKEGMNKNPLTRIRKKIVSFKFFSKIVLPFPEIFQCHIVTLCGRP